MSCGFSALLAPRILNDLLALCLIPVTSLKKKFFCFNTSVCKSFYRIFCSVLSIDVFRVTLNHDIGNFAVAIDITFVFCFKDFFALICS